MRNKGFTLIELIVVITILAILGTIAFISFKGYTSDARDSVRISASKQISMGLNLLNGKGDKLPLPENNNLITLGGKTIGNIGVFGNSNAVAVNISGKITDPLDGTFYDYSVNPAQNDFSLLVKYEKDMSYLTTAKAQFEDRDLKVYGDGVGILLNEDNSPITSDVNIDSVTTQTYKLLRENNKISLDKNALSLAYTFNKENLKNDSSLLGYWDMETKNQDGYIANLNGDGNYLKPVLGDNSNTTTFLSPYAIDLAPGVNGKGLNQVKDESTLDDNYCMVTKNSLVFPAGFTVSMYVKRTSGVKHSEEELFSNKKFFLRTRPNGENNVTPNEYEAFSNRLVSSISSLSSNWDHVVLSTDGINEYSLYVNGKKNSNPTFVAINKENTNTKIGCGSRALNNIWYVYNGTVDEVAVWNRGLSEEEVKFISNNFPK